MKLVDIGEATWYDCCMTNSNLTQTISIDVIDDGNVDGAMAPIVEDLDVSYKVLTLVGPGGGHPEVELSGSPWHLTLAVARYCGVHIDESTLMSIKDVLDFG